MNNYKVICIDKTEQAAQVIRAVFNSVPYELKLLTSPEEIISNPLQNPFDLLVVNIANCNCGLDDIKKIQLSFSDPSFIIIDRNYENIENWTGLDSIKFLSINEIESKLPIFLGDFYSKDQSNFESSFTFIELLKNSLYNIKTIILITDLNSNIIFMNKEAEKMFQLHDREIGRMQMMDYMIDGAKVWNYITNHSSDWHENNHRYPVTFTDSLNNEYQKEVAVHKLTVNGEYLLIESADCSGIEVKRNGDKESAILNKFADSIANELMNPVNNISGRIQLMQSDLGSNAKYKKSLDSLENQVNRINETMSKLLTFARLKQDTIPQRIDLNDLLHKMLMDPSMILLTERSDVKLDYRLTNGLPALSGLISHFSLLLKISLEICFECLGKKGQILVETKQLNNYLNKDWILISLNLDYENSLIFQKGCLQEYFKHSNFAENNISIESTIIDHIIHHYQGLCQIDTETQNKEIVMILFPLPKPENVSEDK